MTCPKCLYYVRCTKCHLVWIGRIRPIEWSCCANAEVWHGRVAACCLNGNRYMKAGTNPDWHIHCAHCGVDERSLWR